jgi:hypothetical protein
MDYIADHTPGEYLPLLIAEQSLSCCEKAALLLDDSSSFHTKHHFEDSVEGSYLDYEV